MTVRRILSISAWCTAVIIAFPGSPAIVRSTDVPSVRQQPSRSIQPADSISTDLADYLWPTDAGDIITSTFAEYRPMHFHAGIDISTGDETGYRVYAMRDGDVRRIRVYPNGYGKILYIRHADGYTTAYAHLSRFAGKLEALVEDEQRRLERYPVDLRLAPGEFPVKKGDVVAYTGETGIGTPHLHVEIRDPHDEPINPQLCPNLLIPDTIHPMISELAVIPRGDQSTVNGKRGPALVSLTRAGPTVWTAASPVVISGRAGFAIDAFDKTADERFRRGVYRIRISIDGRTFFEIVHNRAPLENAQSVGIAYDWNLNRHSYEHFQKLFVDVPGALPFYHPSGPNAGLLGDGILGRGEHAYSIVVEDIAGNSAEIRGRLILSEPPLFTVKRADTGILVNVPNPAEIRAIEQETRTTSGHWIRSRIPIENFSDKHLLHLDLPREGYSAIKFTAWNTEGIPSAPRIVLPEHPVTGEPTMELSHVLNGGVLLLTVRCAGVFTVPPVAVIHEGGSLREVPLDPLDVDSYEGIFHLSREVAGTRTIEIHAQVNGAFVTRKDSCQAFPILPGSSGTYRFDDGNLEIRYDSSSVFSPLFLQVEKDSPGERQSYDLSPRMAILRDGLWVRVRPQSARPHSGLYFHGRAGLRYLGALRPPTADAFRGHLSQTLGLLQIRTDDTPPVIRSFTLHVNRNRTVTVSLRLTDNLSGVENESVKTYIDNRFVIPEIDGEHHRIRYQSGDPLERGTHHFVLRCQDRAGNARTLERSFRVR